MRAQQSIVPVKVTVLDAENISTEPTQEAQAYSYTL